MNENAMIKSIDLNRIITEKDMENRGLSQEQSIISDFAHTRTAKTMKGYMIDIKMFFGVTDERNITLEMIRSVTPEIAVMWRDALIRGDGENKPLAANTVNKKLAALYAFYAYLSRPDLQGYTGVMYNPFSSELCQRFKPSPIRRRVLTGDELRLLLSSIETESFKGLRDYILIRLMSVTGLRNQEIRELSTDNIIFNHGKYALRFTGKGNKEREALIPCGTFEMIEKLLKKKRISLCMHDKKLFTKTPFANNSIESKTLNNIIKNRARNAGLKNPDEITPHSFRHTFATLELMEGAQLEEVSKRLGHESPVTTRIYSHMDCVYNNKEAESIDEYISKK